MKEKYKYRPVRFFCTVFTLTWMFCFTAAVFGRSGTESSEGISFAFMLLGLLVPSGAALLTILLSKSAALKNDLRNKLIGFFRVKPLNVISAVRLFGWRAQSKVRARFPTDDGYHRRRVAGCGNAGGSFVFVVWAAQVEAAQPN